MIRYWTILTVSWSTVALSVFGLIVLFIIDYSTTEWGLNIGLVGLLLSLCVLGINNAAGAADSKIQTERYNCLSTRLDTIARRQENLIALVEGSSQHSATADPSLGATSDSAAPANAATDEACSH